MTTRATVRIFSWRTRLGLAVVPVTGAVVLGIHGTWVAATEGLDLFSALAVIAAIAFAVLAVRCLRVRLEVSRERVVVANAWSTRTIPTQAISRVHTGPIANAWTGFPIAGLCIVRTGRANGRPSHIQVSACRRRRDIDDATSAFERFGTATPPDSTGRNR